MCVHVQDLTTDIKHTIKADNDNNSKYGWTVALEYGCPGGERRQAGGRPQSGEGCYSRQCHHQHPLRGEETDPHTQGEHVVRCWEFFSSMFAFNFF